MIEMQLLETNPCILVKRLSTKANVREVYMSPETVAAIAAECPEWFHRILWCALYTGMREGEILGLTRRQVDLTSRIITLGAQDTKERARKRVPIHRELVPILEEAMRTPSLVSDAVFLVQDRAETRPPGTDTLSNFWPRACAKLGLKEPWPRFHDLRGSLKSCARRSGMDPEIRESILGHWFKEKSVSERYGRISNRELLQAIDSMTFDDGVTEILVPQHQKRASKKKGNKSE